MKVPMSFWQLHDAINLCKTCDLAYTKPKRKRFMCCPKCRKHGKKPKPSLTSTPAKTQKAVPCSSIPLDDFPSLEEVFSSPIASEMNIPAHVSHEWSRIYAKLLSDATFHNDYRNWLLLFMFEKIGLAKQPRGGKKVKNFLRAQLKAWKNDPIALWNKRMQGRTSKPNSPTNSPGSRGKRAIQCARDGLFSRARETCHKTPFSTSPP